jgi:hypothetical protein
MAGNQLSVDFAAVQSLTSFTESSQQDQANASSSFSQRTSDTVSTGLAGTVRNAAESVGQERDGHWRQTHDGNQRLVDNNRRAVTQYSDGQDSAHNAMTRTSYGTGSVINP